MDIQYLGLTIKLLLPKIPYLDYDEWLTIYHNTELRSLFLKRLKHNAKVDLTYIPEEIEKLIKRPGNFRYYLDTCKNEGRISEFLSYFCNLYSWDEKEIELHGEGIHEDVIEYYQKNKDEIFDLFIKNLDKIHQKVSNGFMVDAIVDNNLPEYINLLKTNPYARISGSNLENFIIDNLDSIDYQIDVYSEKIAKTCIEKKKAYILSRYVWVDTNLFNVILSNLDDGLDSEKIDIPCEAIVTEREGHVGVYRYLIEKNYDLYIDNDTFSEFPSLEDIVIKKLQSDNYFTFGRCDKYPKVVAAKIANIYDFQSSYERDWNCDVSEGLNNDKDGIIERALIDQIKANKNIAFNIFKLICSDLSKLNSNMLVYVNLLKNILPIITCEEILKNYDNTFYGFSKVALKEIFKLYGSYLNMSITKLPENFDIKADYPEEIMLAAIPFIPVEKFLDCTKSYFESPILLEKVLEKVTEAENKSYIINRIIYGGYDYKLTIKSIQLILREDNPLDITIGEIRKLLRNNEEERKNIDLLSIIKSRKSKMLYADFLDIYHIIFNIDNYRLTYKSIYEFNDESLTILKEVLSCNIDEPVEVCSQLAKAFSWFNENRFYDVDNYFWEIFNVSKVYIMKNSHIPLKITSELDEETRYAATYNYDDLSKNPGIFDYDYNAPKDYHEWIIDAAKKNIPINIYLIHKEVRTNPNLHYLLCGDNVTYENINHNYVIETINRIITDSNVNDDIRKKCIINYLEKCDISSIYNGIIIEYIIKNEEIFKQFLNKVNDRVESGKALSISGSIIDCLTMKYSPEFEDELKEMILKLLLDGFIVIDISNISTYLKINNERLNEYLTKYYFSELSISVFRKIFGDNDIYNAIKSNSKMYSAFMDILINNIQYLGEMQCNINDHTELVQFYINYINNLDEINLTQCTLWDIHFNIDIMKTILDKKSSLVRVYVDRINEAYSIKMITQAGFVDSISEYIAKEYNINPYAIRKLYNIYDEKIFRLLVDEDKISLLKCGNEVIDRFIEIFKVRKLDRVAIEAINDSFQQQIYTKENQDDINLFTTIRRKAHEGLTDEFIKSVVDKLCKKDDKGNYIYIPEGLNIPDILLNHLYNTNKETFICVLISKIKNDDEDIYKTLLHVIIDNYIGEKRKEVNRNENIFTDTYIDFEYDEKQLKDAKFKYLLVEDIDRIIEELKIYDSEISDLDLDTLTYLRTPEKLNCDKERIKQIKKNIQSIKERLDYLLLFEINISDIPEKYIKNIKKTIINEKRKQSMDDFEFMNITSIINIINDDEKYYSLVSLINKYKILEWSDTFEPAIEKLTNESCIKTLIPFINAFGHIYDIEKREATKKKDSILEALEKRLIQKAGEDNIELIKGIKDYIKAKKNEPVKVTLTPYKIYQYTSIYLSNANGYKILLGPEDADLISVNPGPYSSSATEEERLEYCSKLMLKMVQTDEVTIPSFVKDYEFENQGKKPLRAIVACKADPRNLTVGERTGACLRAFGHDHELFTFSNTDPRGFQIIFEDPTDNKFISRVTGFRNGNTVCLNTLRLSCDTSRYTTKDVIEACKDISKELIERSKDSDMPIENVICDDSYALQGYETTELSEQDIGGNVFAGAMDITRYAVLMATSRKDGKPEIVKPDAKNQPKYKCCRLPLKRYERSNITFNTKILLQRIKVLRETYESGDQKHYQYIDYNFDVLNAEFVYIILGQDFYVALDIDGNILHDICVDKDEAQKEYQNAISEVEEYKLERAKGSEEEARSA